MDDPNRQAVGLEPAWVEGTGGEAGGSEPPTEPPPEGNGEEPAPEEPATANAGETPTAEELDAMTKDDLLALAQSLGISPANAAMTKGDLRASVDAYYAAR